MKMIRKNSKLSKEQIDDIIKSASESVWSTHRNAISAHPLDFTTHRKRETNGCAERVIYDTDFQVTDYYPYIEDIRRALISSKYEDELRQLKLQVSRLKSKILFLSRENEKLKLDLEHSLLPRSGSW